MLIALVGRLNQTFGVGKEFDVITAAVLGGTSLFGGVGGAFGAVVGSVLVQMVQAGMVFVKVNLYLQPMVLAGDHLPRRLLRQPARSAPGKTEAPVHPRGEVEGNRRHGRSHAAADIRDPSKRALLGRSATTFERSRNPDDLSRRSPPLYGTVFAMIRSAAA